MSTGPGSQAVRHASNRYRRLVGATAHPIRTVESEASHLHDIERRGESGETPFIAMLGLVLFLLPIFLLIVGLALGAAYLFG